MRSHQRLRITLEAPPRPERERSQISRSSPIKRRTARSVARPSQTQDSRADQPRSIRPHSRCSRASHPSESPPLRPKLNDRRQPLVARVAHVTQPSMPERRWSGPRCGTTAASDGPSDYDCATASDGSADSGNANRCNFNEIRATCRTRRYTVGIGTGPRGGSEEGTQR